MDMCYDGALVMPSSYAVMDAEEMSDVGGGSIILPMNKSYMNKSVCLSTAKTLISNKMVTGMSQTAIAQEIYAHAILYYDVVFVNAKGFDNKVLQEIKSRASKVDITNGGDKLYRRAAYSALWNLPV